MKWTNGKNYGTTSLLKITWCLDFVHRPKVHRPSDCRVSNTIVRTVQILLWNITIWTILIQDKGDSNHQVCGKGGKCHCLAERFLSSPSVTLNWIIRQRHNYNNRWGYFKLSNVNIQIFTNSSVALVRERTIPTERQPLVSEFSANFSG
jgi:hypothetical protein